MSDWNAVNFTINPTAPLVKSGFELFSDIGLEPDNVGTELPFSRRLESGGRFGQCLFALGTSFYAEGMYRQADGVNLASAKRTRHIIYGDKTGGGHGIRLGNILSRMTKSRFPVSWSDEKIMTAVSTVATDPLSLWRNQTGIQGAFFTKAGIPARFIVTGQYDGVRIVVIVQGGDIVTAWPAK